MISTKSSRHPRVETEGKVGEQDANLLLPSALTLTFILTALIGVWAAYDRAVAWTRFSLIVAGIVLALVIVWEGRRAFDSSTIRVLYVGGLVAVVVGALWLGSPLWGHALLHANAAGGALAIVIPFGIAGTYHAWTRRSLGMTAVLGAGVIVAGIALVLTNSRGAWIGSVAGIIVAGLLWRRALSRRQAYLALVIIAGIALAGFWVAVRVPAFEQQLQIAGADGSTLGRITVWRDMLDLVQDYPLTGSGLGTTAMVYSSYVLLLHVPFLYHAHNIFLQIAVEQGLVGLVAFVGLAAIALYAVLHKSPTSEQQRWFRAATTASLVAVLVHGMFDAELYVSQLTPLVFFPIGSALLLTPAPSGDVSPWRPTRLAGACIALVGITVLFPGTRAMIHANLGTVAQTRAELSVYDWPAWPIQDAVRREVDLSPAIAHYQTALILDSSNATANRRLGQIELSLGQYESAGRHLRAAAAQAPRHRATQQMLGEYQAISGDVDGAVALWQNIDTSHGQLELRRWWYNDIALTQRLPYIDDAIARIDR